ncbi:hypothetical protein ACT29H_13995 [Thermophagus sp. OGC60D27]|uniref:hypothetical protein n=1 Tax=Thermophagus sp. OGC60D27 TaxID=3458415 RepID=UPI0040381432
MNSGKTTTLILLTIISLCAVALSQPNQSQHFYSGCMEQIDDGFIHNSQPMKALLTGSEVAEFRTTLFEGNIYRIVTCSPTNKKIWFSIYDTNNNLLFSTTRHNFSSSWDFEMKGNLECKIEAGLMPGEGNSGMAVILIGVKSLGNPSL